MLYLPVVCLARSHLVLALELLLQAVEANAIVRNSLRRNKIIMAWLIKHLHVKVTKLVRKSEEILFFVILNIFTFFTCCSSSALFALDKKNKYNYYYIVYLRLTNRA